MEKRKNSLAPQNMSENSSVLQNDSTQNQKTPN